jgi:hypothetical protein
MALTRLLSGAEKKLFLSMLDDRPWLNKENPPELNQGLIKRILWQKFKLEKLENRRDVTFFCSQGFSFGRFSILCNNEPKSVVLWLERNSAIWLIYDALQLFSLAKITSF